MPEKIRDPRIRCLLGRVERVDRNIANLADFKSGAIVQIKTVDGRVIEKSVCYPKGAALRGITWADIAEKYVALMPYGNVADAAIQKTLTLIRQLDAAKDLNELMQSLRA